MELAILLILIVAVACLYRDVRWIAYLIGIVETFLRVIHMIGDKLGVVELNSFINHYLPTSIFSIIGKYSSGIIYDLLSWVAIGFLVLFIYYLVRYFIKKKYLIQR